MKAEICFQVETAERVGWRGEFPEIVLYSFDLSGCDLGFRRALFLFLLVVSVW